MSNRARTGRLLAMTITALGLGAPVAAVATAVSHSYVLTASAFYPLINAGTQSPYQSVTAKFTLTYDRLVSQPEGPVGVMLTQLDTPLGSPVAFRYDYLDALDIGVIQLGGSSDGIAGLGSDDFFLAFQFTGLGTPQFSGFGFGDGTIPNEYFYAGSGSVAEVAAIPEPAVWLLMIAGFGVVCTRMRRRRSYATA